jgi:hypothetical protein
MSITIALNFTNTYLAFQVALNTMYKHNASQLDTIRIDIPGGSGKINCDATYIVSILKLKDDIKNSVVRPGGYMEDLRNNSALRSKFVIAINQIFDPEITD